MLLGILREDEGVAARILSECGVSAEQARADLLRFVGKGPSTTRNKAKEHRPLVYQGTALVMTVAAFASCRSIASSTSHLASAMDAVFVAGRRRQSPRFCRRALAFVVLRAMTPGGVGLRGARQVLP
ncbi:MAG: Clp protease N-terminal domain-containing protein [Thermomicrobiales bacterium]